MLNYEPVSLAHNVSASKLYIQIGCNARSIRYYYRITIESAWIQNKRIEYNNRLTETHTGMFLIHQAPVVPGENGR